MISLIVCKTKRGNVIGKNNMLPWKQKHDMQRFKALTVNKSIVVGRKTWESFGSKPLPNRLSHIVITRNADSVKGAYPAEDLNNRVIAVDLEFFNTMYVHYITDNEEFMVIGGEEIYKEFMDSASTLYVTELDADEVQGDTYFPEIDLTKWKLFAREDYKANIDNQYDYSFLTYVRLKDAV